MLPKSLFLTNYLLLIFYVSWNINERPTTAGSSIPLLIASLMLIDITYISSCNIRESKVLNLFCGLLALDSWYMILSFEAGLPKQTVLTLLHPIICYFSIKFVLMFLFQGGGYSLKKNNRCFPPGNVHWFHYWYFYISQGICLLVWNSVFVRVRMLSFAPDIPS